MRAYNADAIVRTWPMMALTARSAAPLFCFSYFSGHSGTVGCYRLSHTRWINSFGRVFMVCLDHHFEVSEPVDEVEHMVDRPFRHFLAQRCRGHEALEFGLHLHHKTGDGNPSLLMLTVSPMYLQLSETTGTSSSLLSLCYSARHLRTHAMSAP